MAIENLESMTREERQAERDRLAAAARTILDRSNGTLSDTARVEYDEHLADLTAIRDRNRHEDDQHALIRAAYDRNPDGGEQYDPNAHRIERGTPGNDDRGNNHHRQVDGLRGRALDLIERSERTSPHLTRTNLEKLTELVERDDSGIDIHAQWMLAVGTDVYRSAFAKVLRGRQHEWSPTEARAVDESRRLERAMGLTDGSGGYMIPAQLDPAVILTSGGSVHPFRQIARTVVATGDVWSGVSSAGVTAQWIAEATEVADATPTLLQPTVALHKFDAFVPFSVEIEGDAQNFLGELSKLMSDGVDQLHATAFATGSGTGQPWGIISALIGTGSIVTGTTMTAAEVVSVQNALPARFQPRAQWAASLPIANTIGQFESAAGARLYPEITGNPRALLGKPFHEASTMDSTIAAGVTADYVLVYGDWSNYVIADRVGTRAELVPHLMGASGFPKLQRGLVLWGRVGADSVNDNAFRLLNAAS